MHTTDYDIIVVGAGHAGSEAAWAGANLGGRVALLTMDLSKIGTMSCNPAIGGLAKGQMVREIDALGGLMSHAADATGIQFRILNASKGPAVHGPRCQSDKYRYAAEVARLLKTREQIQIIQGTVQEILVEKGACRGIVYQNKQQEKIRITAHAVVLTTGTFMRGLMHTGATRTPGGRVGEPPAKGISHNLQQLGFDLGRLKTGTPPRLDVASLDLKGLDLQPGDEHPVPFSDATCMADFPVLPQQPCWITYTCQASHDHIKNNLDRAPLYNGQIDSGSVGPRYCPSIEDKVVRFADRSAHHVFLEPESLDSNEIYCNGISTSLPEDVQDVIVRNLPGCEHARILRYGYAVEYDMVWPHQIDATCMTKKVTGLFLAGQINGTSGYEEAAGQGLIAGLNAMRYARRQELVRFRRDEAYLGVMMDDLVTRTPREPYRMFTSRAEYRLLLRSDNASWRLTPRGHELGLVNEDHWRQFQARDHALNRLSTHLANQTRQGVRLLDLCRRPEASVSQVRTWLEDSSLETACHDPRLIRHLLADLKYEGYLNRQTRDIRKLQQQEQYVLPSDMDYSRIHGMRHESRQVLNRFKPRTMGQASRIAGITPADMMVLSLAMTRSEHS